MVVRDVCVNQLREKRKQWIECLDGDDDNSISKQLLRMTRNITAFRVLMENAFDLAPDAEEGGKQLNRLLFGLLQDSFLASLLLGCRRLMDSARLDGNRGVYSIRSLLDDIGSHAHLLTRDAIIQLGPPDEILKDRNHGDEFLRDWSCTKNQLVDDFTGVNEDQRLSDDQIPRDVFDTRCQSLGEGFKKAEMLINKEIAHAATPESRDGFDYQGILWGDLYDFHGELCKTAIFLHDLISETGMNSFLPVFQGDEFQYLSRPIVAEKDLQRLADRWAALEAEYKSLNDWRPGTDAG